MPQQAENDSIETRSEKSVSLGSALDTTLARIVHRRQDIPDKECEACGTRYFGGLHACPECERRAEIAAQQIEYRRARRVEARQMVAVAFGGNARTDQSPPLILPEAKAVEIELAKPAPLFFLFGRMGTERDRLKYAAIITRRWLENNSVRDQESVRAINWIHAPAWWDSFMWRILEPKMLLPALILENVGSGFAPPAWIVLTTMLERRLAIPGKLTICTSRFSPDEIAALDAQCLSEGVQAMTRIVLPTCCKLEV